MHSGGKKTQYSSSNNSNRDAPWNEHDEMDGQQWKLDEGALKDYQLVFKGTDTPFVYRTIMTTLHRHENSWRAYLNYLTMCALETHEEFLETIKFWKLNVEILIQNASIII